MAENPFMDAFLQGLRQKNERDMEDKKLKQQQGQFDVSSKFRDRELTSKEKEEDWSRKFREAIGNAQYGVIPPGPGQMTPDTDPERAGLPPLAGISGQQPYSAPASGSPGVPGVGPLSRTTPEPQLTNPPTTGFDPSRTTMPDTSGPPVQADSNNPAANFARTLFGMQGGLGDPSPADTLNQPTPGLRMMPTQAGAANEMVGQGAGQGGGGGAISPADPFALTKMLPPKYRNVNGYQVPQEQPQRGVMMTITPYMEKQGFGKAGTVTEVPIKEAATLLGSVMSGQTSQIASENKATTEKAPQINQQIMATAVKTAALDPASHDAMLAAGVDPSKVESLEDLPLRLQEKAIMHYGRMQPNADMANLMKLAITAKDNAGTRELNDKQVLAGEKAQTVAQHPEAIFNITDQEEKRLVEHKLHEAGEKIPINKPDNNDKTAMSNSNLVFNMLNTVRRITKQLGPEATGAVAGRYLAAEQKWGAPIFDKDPRRASLEAQLQQSMTYLMGVELKTVFTGRPAVTMLNMMKEASPNMNQYYGRLHGQINGMEEMAANRVKAARDRMYDDTPTPPRRIKGPADPQTGLPSYKYSWDGGKTWLP